MRVRLSKGRLRVKNQPVLDLSVVHVWQWFQDLDASRMVSGQAGIVPISYAEIAAYASATGEIIRAWEVRAIRAADDAVMTAISNHAKKSK